MNRGLSLSLLFFVYMSVCMLYCPTHIGKIQRAPILELIELVTMRLIMFAFAIRLPIGSSRLYSEFSVVIIIIIISITTVIVYY